MFRVNVPKKIYRSRAYMEVSKTVMKAATQPGSIVAVIGPIGIGKTVATLDTVGRLEEDNNCVIWAQHPEKERLRIGSIMTAMVRVLGETPRRDMDARTEQLRRLLGVTVKEKRIILVIEEAHALHRSTLRALKRILELNFGRRMGLFSIVLIAQPDLYGKLSRLPEISLRTKAISMRALSEREALEFSDWVRQWEGVKVEKEALHIIARRVRNPLRISAVMDRLAEISERTGTITKAMVQEFFSQGIKERMEAYGITQTELAAKAGRSRSAVSQFLSGQYRGDTTGLERELKTAIEEVIVEEEGKTRARMAK